jgi:hypothetical protein
MKRPRKIFAFIVAIAGCDGIFGPGADQELQYLIERFEVIEEEVEWAPFPVAYVVAEVGLVNTGRDSTTVRFDWCTFDLEAFGADRSGEPAWRSQTHTSWPGSTPFVCPSIAFVRHVAPGDTLHAEMLRTKQPLGGILADSLPGGLYEFRARIHTESNPLLIDLGQLDLPVSRYPLPEHVAYRDGFRYEVRVDDAAAAEGSSAAVRLDVAYTAKLTMALEREFSAACPVRLLAFERAEDVTTIPQPEAAWSWPETCPLGTQTVTLMPGGSRRFEEQMDLEPVAASAGPGRYHLIAILEVDDRPIRVSAGAIDVPQ